MRRLYLLRHAKSSWDDPALADRDRPLSPRGRRAAKAIADHLGQEGLSPALVLCSSALRTRLTLAAILPSLDGDSEIRVEGALYGAGAAGLLERLRAVPEQVPSVLVIGHNPGLQELAVSLSGSGEALRRLREHFPTGGLATLAIEDAGWAHVGVGDAEVVRFVVPRELGD